MVDGKGVRISADRAWGRTVEVALFVFFTCFFISRGGGGGWGVGGGGGPGRNHYFRKLPEHCDDQMRQVMEATDVDGLALKKVMDW